MSNKERIGIILDVDAEVSKAKGSISSLTKIFDSVGGSKGNQLRNILSEIGTEYGKLAKESGKSMSKIGDFTKSEKSSERLNQLLRQLNKEMTNIGKSSKTDLSKLFPTEVADRVKKASDAVKTYNSILENSNKKKGAIGAVADEYKKQETAVKNAKKALEELEKISTGASKKQVVTAGIKTDKQNELRTAKADLQVYTEELQKAQDAMVDLEKRKPHLWENKSWNRSQEFKDLNKELQTAQQNFDNASNKVSVLNRELKNMIIGGDLDEDIKDAKDALAIAEQAAEELRQKLNNITATEFTKALDEAKKKLEGLTDIDLSKITNVEDLNVLFERFTNEGLEGVKKGLEAAGVEIRELGNQNDQVQEKIRNTTEEVKKQNQALAEIDSIKNRILQFFSLTNGITMARKVISEATQAIKELDAAMTETAVVTDFSVGDMWDALPQYTQAANELGATTLGAYETMTLFYQQGLETNEVFALGTETMKMARIANLDYAEATDLMTAALRGFNMELNETSAQRINDVYSELAAITAADTEEIATAMTKTASIADSANMEFETTAALLSQIIETTREPAETAGTAMKTIIARFTEMKKATSDLINIDGEEVSVNKVEDALKSAGVALRDVNGEFRDLDDVFLELSSRWDSLDIMTQRYIATTAAGSRQQSRFIAMMQDYDRTIELVDAAYDSAGASAQQFAKTQDSFEAKMNNLNNAWNEYLLSLSNSDVVKGAIDALTKLLNLINDLTEGGGALTSSLLKIFTAVSGFKVLRQIFKQNLGSIGNLFQKEGKVAGNSFSQGIQTSLNKIKINMPFIGALKKELKSIKQEINSLNKDGKAITIGNLQTLNKTPNVTMQLSNNLGQQVNQYLQKELSKIGTLTDEGQKWADELINGFIAELSNGTKIEEALTHLNNKINNGLVTVTPKVDTGMVDADGNPIMSGGEKTTNTKLINPINKGAPKNINVNNTPLNPNDLKNMEQKAAQLASALSVTGMTVSALGAKLSEQSGALGTFGDMLEVVGGAASAAGMALMGFNAVAKVVEGLSGVAGGYLGIILAAATAVIAAIAGVIQKHKEMQQEAQQLTLDTAKKTQEEVAANRELVNSLDETIKAYQEGTASREDVAQASEELVNKYDLENDEVLLLTGNYESLTKAIKEKIKAQEEENFIAQKSASTVSRNKLMNSNLVDIQSMTYGSFISDEITVDNKFKKEFQNILEDYNFTDIISLGTGGTLSFNEDISSFTDDQLTQLYNFIKKYLVLLEETLLEQELTPEDSEVFLKLADILGNTSSTFEELIETIDATKDSLMNMAGIEFEKDFDLSTISNYNDYATGRDQYISLLQEMDKTLTLEEATELAEKYFNKNEKTKTYAQADKIIFELQSKFSADDLNTLDIYTKYINGEISAEEFIRLLVSVDIEAKTNIDEIEKEVEVKVVTSVISAPQDFYDASVGITDYINENFTMEGIDEKVLEEFQMQLRSMSAILPSNIDLLDEWNYALQQGTLGIAQFIVDVQSLLNTQSLMMSEAVINSKIYGISGTDEDISKDIKIWNNEKTTSEQKQEIASYYGMDVNSFQSGADLYNKNQEEQEKILTQGVVDAKAWVARAKGDSDYIANQSTLNDINNKIPELENKLKQLEQSKEQAASNEATIRQEGTDYVKGGGTPFDDHHLKINSAATYYKDLGKQITEEIEKTKKELEGLNSEKITVEAKIEADNSKFNDKIEEAESKLKALQEKTAVKQQLEIEVAMRDAEQITTLRTQLAQLQSLTKDGFKVDLSTFEQMRAIAPEIGNDVKILADGTLDVSAGMKNLNSELEKTVKLKGDSAKATLQEGIAAENALQIKLKAAIDAIDAELQAQDAGEAEKQRLEEQTQEALTQLNADGSLDRALLFEEEAKDQSEAAAQGATNVINTVEAMDTAYCNLGGTLDTIHQKMMTLGTPFYTKIKLKTEGYDAARSTANNINKNKVVDDTTYTADDVQGWITDPDKLANTETPEERKKRLQTTKDYLKGLYDDSVAREGDYGAAISAIFGGGDKYGTESGSGKGGGSKKNSEKNYTNPSLENINERLENLERKRKNGEIDALTYEQQKKGLLSLKAGYLKADLDNELKTNKERNYFYRDEESGALLLKEKEFNQLSDKRKNEVEKEYERIKKINDTLNEVNSELGQIAANANTVDAINASIETVERSYKNREIDVFEYTNERDTLLAKKSIILQATLDDELETNVEKRFFYYDEVLDTVMLNEEEFNKLSEERQEEVRKEYEKVKEINDELNEIEDTLKDFEFKTPEDRQQFQRGEAIEWNTEGDLDSLNRKRDELGRYDELIGKLPSEMQGPLSLVTGATGMLYEAEESQILRRREEGLRQQVQAKESSSMYFDNGKNKPDSVVYYYDEATQSYQLKEDKYAELTGEQQKEVMDELTELSGYLKDVNEIQAQRSGGIFQKPFYLAEKSAKAMSKAFKNTGNTAKDVKDAFNDLEDALGLSTTALDGFESKFTDLIETSGLKEKEIKGLGLLNEKQFSAIGDSKLGGMLGDNSKNLLGMLLGEGSTNGMDFAQTGLNAFGEMMGLGGDLMSFDMMSLGLDMFNTGKGIIDQGKQMVEKIIGYITQATQVIVDAWTNREDYLYNFLKIIEKHLQEYEKLQRYSTQLEKGRLSSSQDILRNWNAQWKSLQQQLEEQTERLETRQKELDRSRWNPFSLISGWDPTSDTLYENREVKFMWDLLIGFGQMAPMGLGSFFSQLNQLYEDYDKRVQNSYEDRLAAEQALLDIEDERLELVKVGSEEATEFEQKLLDAMIQKEQEQIDELTRLNDAITDANSKLISTLQDNLDKMRQDRENEKKEEELGEKERRLAYLRQDTSGANMMEIKKLEEELEEGHEDYTDTLIDQKISELEKQNELAAEQRQQQIDLLQGQLDYAEKYGLYWDAIYGMLYTIDENGNAVLNPENFDLDGNIRENSQLAQMLGTFSDRLGMSVWSSVLDNEETKRLGRYYGAFIGMNGVDGDWANYWALKDPGANDPNYAYPEQEIPDGLWGVLYRMEINFKKYFANSDPDLINRGGRIEESFKNFFGKLFGNEEWANYKYEGVNPSRVQSTTVAGMKEFSDNTKEWFASGFEKISSKAKNGFNVGGTQNYGAVTENYNFNIGTVGENISLDDMVDRVSSAIRGLFTSDGVGGLQKKR